MRVLQTLALLGCMVVVLGLDDRELGAWAETGVHFLQLLVCPAGIIFRCHADGGMVQDVRDPAQVGTGCQRIAHPGMAEGMRIRTSLNVGGQLQAIDDRMKPGAGERGATL